MANNVRYTAARRRQIEADRAAVQLAEDRADAALTLDQYLANAAAAYGKTHNSNVAAGEDVEFFAARHAELVARFATA